MATEFQLWKLEHKTKDETIARRLEDSDTLLGAVALAAQTGVGKYQISDLFGPRLTIRVHSAQVAAQLTANHLRKQA